MLYNLLAQFLLLGCGGGGGGRDKYFFENFFFKTKYDYLATHIKIHKETNLFSNFRTILIKNLEKFKYLFLFSI